MDEVALLEKFIKALGDGSLLQVLDDAGFIFGVGLGSFFVMTAGAFLLAEGFAALAGKPHLPFGRTLAGAMVVCAAAMGAALVYGLLGQAAGTLAQVAAASLVVLAMLAVGNWLVLQAAFLRALALAPFFALLVSLPMLVFTLIIWPGAESRFADAKENLEGIDLSEYGIGDRIEVDAVDELEERLKSRDTPEAIANRALARREAELNTAYAAIKERHEASASWTPDQQAAYRQLLRRYEEAVQQFRSDRTTTKRAIDRERAG